MDPFALLDDAGTGTLMLLDDLRKVDTVRPEDLDAALDAGWSEALHCLAWLPYEWGTGTGAGLYWFARSTLLDAFPDAGAGGLSPLLPNISRADYDLAITRVLAAIAAGDSYQANLTFRLHGTVTGDPAGLYRTLRQRQPTGFGLLAHLPGPADAWTLSLSPELFLEVDRDQVTARPMKGTAPGHLTPESLSADPKNRAENLMIVDLLRNDLSRVADDVEVVDLFGVERVGDLWQMSTTVRGRLRPGVGPAELLGATFPCGSVTGAPKTSSMELIRSVESTPRGIYTGALGIIAPSRMRLSVAIRTLTVDDRGAATLGVGAGIVADSTAEGEWRESLAKAGFARRPNLKEAVRVVDGTAALLALHEARVRAAAAELGYPVAAGAVAREVHRVPPGNWRLGIEIAPDGTLTTMLAPLPDPGVVGPVSILLARRPWAPRPHSHLKTSDRAHLDEAWRAAEAVGAFDTIGFDAADRVLEGGRCNVFVHIDGRWITPASGVLPGVQRAALLADPAQLGTDHIEEADVSVSELRRAARIVVTNAVVGVMEARLEERP